MSFIISKLAWALLNPGTLLVLFVVTAWLLQSRTPRLSRYLLGLSALFLITLSISPIGAWAIESLQSKFPAAHLGNSPVDGIIVLGGGLDPTATQLAGSTVLNDAAERLTAFVALAKSYPQAKLVFSGGSGDPLRPDAREADEVKALFASLGLNPDRVLYERDSRNTYENAVFSNPLAKPEGSQRWLLVTSAWHMPRAIGCFQGVGWQVTPYPVDYRGLSQDRWAMFLPDQQLDMLTTAAREWLGLVSYRLMGRIP